MNEPVRPIAPPVDRSVQPVTLPQLTPRQREEEKERRERKRREKAAEGAERTPDGRLDIRV